MRNIVQNRYVANPAKRGPKKKTTSRDKTRILRTVKKLTQNGERVTAAKVRDRCDMSHISTRTMQRNLASSGLKHMPAQSCIVLSQHHKNKRVRLATQWIESGIDWKTVIFTDEKRFNGDGPDSWKSWMDPSNPVTRNRRQQGGPSVQIWGAILPTFQLRVFELPPRGDSKTFMDFFEHQVMPQLPILTEPDMIMQQDNATVHTSAYSKARFAELGLDLLSWPARSPDLNIIENCWSMLTSRVYDCKQYSNRASLLTAIFEAAEHINEHQKAALENLYKSIPKRLLECINKRGKIVNKK